MLESLPKMITRMEISLILPRKKNLSQMKSRFTFLKNQLKARDKKNSLRILINMVMTQRKYLRQSSTNLIGLANWKNSFLSIEWMSMGTLCVSERLERSWL